MSKRPSAKRTTSKTKSKTRPSKSRPKNTQNNSNKIKRNSKKRVTIQKLRPNIEIKIEPLESGKAAALPLAPNIKNKNGSVKIGLRLAIKNNEDQWLRVDSITFSFPNSNYPEKIMEDRNFILKTFFLKPGDVTYWSNGRENVSLTKTENWKNNMVFLPTPGPSTVQVNVRCNKFSHSVSETLDLAPYKAPTPEKSYLFPFYAEDMRNSEYCITSAVHWSNGGDIGRELYAHDILVQGIDNKSKKWTSLLPEGTKIVTKLISKNQNKWTSSLPKKTKTPIDLISVSAKEWTLTPLVSRIKNSHFRIWKQPVHAIADGVVSSDPLNTMNDNTVIGEQNPTPDPAAGNNLWIKHGTVQVRYAHFKKGSIPKSLKKGSTVKAGQIIGLVGNSGNSTEPHLHIECKDSTSGALRPFPFHNAWVIQKDKLDPVSLKNKWIPLLGTGIPQEISAVMAVPHDKIDLLGEHLHKKPLDFTKKLSRKKTNVKKTNIKKLNAKKTKKKKTK